MNEDELTNLLDELEQGLIQAGLSSLVNQERISAVEGRVEEVTQAEALELRRERPDGRPRRAPGVKPGDVRIRPLSVSERLAELLDLVEVAVGGSYAIEVNLREDLRAAFDDGNQSWNGEVIFADPLEAELITSSRAEWMLQDQSTLRQRGTAVQQVISLVNQLRDLARLQRSERLRSITGIESDSNGELTTLGDWT
jgi:hypothetical protein